jgi:phosphotransferase system enzyme I (PtsI)
MVAREYAERQAAVEGETFSEKSLDIEDVAERLLRSLAGSSALTGDYTDAVVIAVGLRPTNVLDLLQSRPAALVTLGAGWTSHTSIIAREFKVPMVSGAEDILKTVAEGDRLIVDATDGEVIIDATQETVDAYRSKIKTVVPAELATDYVQKQPMTLDGTSVYIKANADSPKAYAQAFQMGARGVGLFRSESLIRLSNLPPSEDDQLTGYVAVADAAGKDGIKIRTLDIETGDDGASAGFSERNPALGLRSIRLSLADVDRFRTQIRAILRASFGRRIDIVLPMVSGAVEINEARKLIDAERKTLIEAGLDVGSPGVGAMIEVPSAVLTVRDILRTVDFLCLGTNDLVQYLLAVDRDNHAVADWYQTLHPAVIRALGEVFTAAVDASKPVTVCGEMAGSPFYVPLLLGLGARELSMNVNSIQRVRRLIAGISLKDCVDLADAAGKLQTAHEIEDLLRHYYLDHWSDLFPPGFLEARYR